VSHLANGKTHAALLRGQTFRGDPSQVAEARRFVRSAIIPSGPAADAVLMASELATNAIQHTGTGRGGTFDVVVTRLPGGVRVAVTDEGAVTAPQIAGQHATGLSGRGLAIVEALASRWGHHGDQNGRTVWFELDE